MAKQRRPQPKLTKTQVSPSASQTSQPASTTSGDSGSAGRPADPSSGPQRRATYYEALALYERGLATLQRHDYGGAATLFESVLRQYPDEKELHERVRLYLSICRRQA